MKLCLTTSFFALAACGGSPAATLPGETVVVLDPPDAQAVLPEADPPNAAEASSEAPSTDPPDAADAADVVPLGTHFDAGQPETDAADSTPEADVALDVSAACTPLSTTLYFPCAGSSMQANGLSQYCESTVGNPPSAGVAATPDECRCRETYNCACILPHVTCGDSSAPVNCFDPLATDKHGDPTSAVRVICQ